ncbi:nuclear transport factor 2 family protein [Aeromicrobium sp.]|uniref:nuclear transport factor 2 family protein n=1 Tax=Aeromicrobium sp. TaxID=1871063 RepID=UPI003D6B71A3
MNNHQVVEKALLELEQRGWHSLCDGTGATFYSDLMTDDAVMVLANGAVMDRDAVVASLEHAPPWHSYEINDVRLVDAGEETAALVYVGTGYRDGDQPAFVSLMSSTYVRREGRWRLALYQQTPISG